MSIHLPQEALDQHRQLRQLQRSAVGVAPERSGSNVETNAAGSKPDIWTKNDALASPEIKATGKTREEFHKLMDYVRPQFEIVQIADKTETPPAPDYIKQSGEERTWDTLMWRLKEAADYSAKSGGIQTYMVQNIEYSIGALFRTVRGANTQQLEEDLLKAIKPFFQSDNGYIKAPGQTQLENLIRDLCSGKLTYGEQFRRGETPTAMNERYTADQAAQQAARLAVAQEARQSPTPTIVLEMPQTSEDKGRVITETPTPAFYDKPKNIDQLAHNIALYCRANNPPEKEAVVKMLRDFLGPVPETNKHTLYCNTVNTIAHAALHSLFHPEYAGSHPGISSRNLSTEQKALIADVFRESLTEITQNIDPRFNTLRLDGAFRSLDRYIY
ncbi:MAG: hypothetical protein LBD62_00510 [Candidatus Margulisbacteria bacterium]|jgi:hypothetical protein|nr:hypothetical protein [Candidatus Margulisiibacteriota bacterium]